jgi:hypothetical protein
LWILALLMSDLDCFRLFRSPSAFALPPSLLTSAF